MKLQASLLAAARNGNNSRRKGRGGSGVRGGRGGRTPGRGSQNLSLVGPKQCAACKQEGDWKNERPTLKGLEEQDRVRNAHLMTLEDSDEEGRAPGQNMKVSPADPLLSVKLGNETLTFLDDTGATYSVLKSRKGPVSQFSMSVIGARGKRGPRPFFQPTKRDIGNKALRREFFCMPECPLPLRGRGSAKKLGAQITRDQNKV